MKSFLTITLAVTMAIGLMACTGKKNEVPQSDESWEETIGYYDRDSTIYGICTEGTTMNTLQIVADGGDTLTLNVYNAKESNKIFGGFSIGDRMAVIANSEKNEVLMAVNQSVLMGEWVMPNPMDGSSEMGIYIKDGGVAESINMGTLLYLSWRLVNGKLQIVSMRDDGANLEETNEYQLIYLSNDSLSFKDEEGTYDYTRPGKGESYDDVDVDLDDGSADDFVM